MNALLLIISFMLIIVLINGGPTQETYDDCSYRCYHFFGPKGGMIDGCIPNWDHYYKCLMYCLHGDLGFDV